MLYNKLLLYFLNIDILDIDKLVTLHNISEMAISKSNSNYQKNAYISVHGKYNIFIIYLLFII